MKTLVLLMAVALLLTAGQGFAEDQNRNPASICADCSWYAGKDGQKGYFEGVWLELEKDLSGGPINKKTGQRISRYDLGELWVKVGAHLKCVERYCADDPKLLGSYRKYVNAINKIISSKRMCSPSPIVDNFSELLKK